MLDRVIQVLRAYSFVHRRFLGDEELDALIEYLQGLADTARELSASGPRVSGDPLAPAFASALIDVPDRKMRVAIVRECPDISLTGEGVMCGKKAYRFDAVFDGASDGYVALVTEFVEARIAAGKSSLLVLYGYSGSGKSTLTGKLLEALPPPKLYSLIESYNGDLFGYRKGVKLPYSAAAGPHLFAPPEGGIGAALEGFSRRASTKANVSSSRSHTLITMHYGAVSVAIADMAGCERLAGNVAESVYINKSNAEMLRFLRSEGRYRPAKNDPFMGLIAGYANVVFVALLRDCTLAGATYKARDVLNTLV